MATESTDLISESTQNKFKFPCFKFKHLMKGNYSLFSVDSKIRSVLYIAIFVELKTLAKILSFKHLEINISN